jgi:hypothetical protein
LQKLSILNTNIDFDIRGANVQMENLFDGKLPALADTVNEFINKNSQVSISLNLISVKNFGQTFQAKNNLTVMNRSWLRWR